MSQVPRLSRPYNDRRRVPPPPLRLNLKVNAKARDLIQATFHGLPKLFGSPICIRTLPELTAWRGKLLTGSPAKGKAVHAASFIRRREIVLEEELVRRSSTFRLIFTHEIFHFVWVRLGNTRRREFSNVLKAELQRGCSGALGESSEVSRCGLENSRGTPGDQQHWSDYVCESFCDTAAWLYAGPTRSRWFTLGKAARASRSQWFHEHFAGGIHC